MLGGLKNLIREKLLPIAAPEGSLLRQLIRWSKVRIQKNLPVWCLGRNWFRPVTRPLNLHDRACIDQFLTDCGLDPEMDGPKETEGLPDIPGGRRVRQLYEFRPDLRELFPLALTPVGQRQFLHWLLVAGKHEIGLTTQEIWLFARECAADPSCGLAATFLMNPTWQQKFPHGLTVFGREALLAWIRKKYRVPEGWIGRPTWPEELRPAEELRLLYQTRRDLQRLAPRAFLDHADTQRLVEEVQTEGHALSTAWWQECRREPGLTGLGVNVLGHFCYPSGLQEATRCTVEGLHRAGIQTSCRDVPANLQCDQPNHRDYLGLERFDHTLLHLAPEPLVRVCYPLAGIARRDDVYRIAVWYWELEQVPLEWRRHARLLHEIWAPTRFIAEAMRSVMPIPVTHMLPGVELKPFQPRERSYFGLAEDRFLFLFVFDMHSVMERKNPLGLISAFAKAFRREEPVTLAIKVSRGGSNPAGWRRLQEEAAAAGVVLLNEVMPREDVYALMHCCDAYVSLHRSEGFGLTMAEAMLMAKPVVATGYSGNLDFMTPANSRLVDYRRIPIDQELPFYRKGCLWAEPDYDQAAAWLRWVYDHPADAQALGERARQDLRRLLSFESAGARMASRLQELRGNTSSRSPRTRAA